MILVTGGRGFIGTHLTRALTELGESCVVVGRHAADVDEDRVHVERLDITDTEALLALGSRYPITGITHLAGSFFGDPIEDVRGNVEGLLSVLIAAREWQVRRVGLASTIGIYGDAGGASPFREDIPLPMTGPHTIATAKKIYEITADFVANATGLEVVNYRIGAIWGPGGRPVSSFMFLPQLVHAAAHGTSLDTSSIFAEGGIDFCYVKDCARAVALLQLAETLNHRTYNVATGRPTSHGEVAAALERLVPDTRFNLNPGRDPRYPTDMYLDVTRLRQDTGFEPEYNLDRAAADYLDWLQAGNER